MILDFRTLPSVGFLSGNVWKPSYQCIMIDGMSNLMAFKKFLSLTNDEIQKTGGVSASVEQRKLLNPRDSWYFPKYPSRTRIVPQSVNLLIELETFIKDNMELLLEEDTFLGVWLNPNTGHYYIDITTSIDILDLAKKTAKDISQREGRKIVTLYNPSKNKTEYLWEDIKK